MTADAKAAFAVKSAARVRVRSLFLAFLAVGCFGLALRFAGFPARVFFTDEGVTAMRTSGHTNAEIISNLVDGRVHTIADLKSFAGYGPRGSTADVIRSLAKEDAQHPPLYYVLTAWWTSTVGFSITSLRLLAVLFGCIVPFAAAWLCFELYGTRLAAALGFAISSVSPVLVLYSQQAREYGLWAAMIALSTAVLLRAARSSSPGWWVAYAFCATAGMYTDTLFAGVLVSHAIYAACLLRGVRLRAFICALGFTAIAFAPWAVEIVRGSRMIAVQNRWSATPWPARMLVEKWIFNAGTTFFDLEYVRAAASIVLVPIFALVAAALYWNFTRAALQRKIMTLSLVLVPVAMCLPDFVLHQHRSSVTRYGMALWIALIVCVAGFLAGRIRRSTKRQLWAAGAAALLAVSAVSTIVDVRSPVGWDNREDGHNFAIAGALNKQPLPLVVVPGQLGRLVALSAYLNPAIHIQMIPFRTIAPPKPGYARAVLFARPVDAAAFRQHGMPLAVEYETTERNAQVRRFQGSDDQTRYLSVWRFERYAGTPP